MAISKFESQLSPGLRELGWAYKIPDAGRSWKPFDFVVGAIRAEGFPIFLAVEGKTARGGTFLLSRIAEHQRKALNYVGEYLGDCCAWLALHYPHVDGFEPLLLPWCLYKSIESMHEKSIPVDVWEDFLRWKLEWDLGPIRKSRYWRLPEDHPLKQLLRKGENIL